MTRVAVFLVVAVVLAVCEAKYEDDDGLQKAFETLQRDNCELMCGNCGCKGYYCGDECICQCDTADDDNVNCIKNLRSQCLKMDFPFEVLIQGPAGRRFVRETTNLDPTEMESYKETERSGRSVYSIYRPKKVGKGELMALDEEPTVANAAPAAVKGAVVKGAVIKGAVIKGAVAKGAVVKGLAVNKIPVLSPIEAKKLIAAKIAAFKAAKGFAFKNAAIREKLDGLKPPVAPKAAKLLTLAELKTKLISKLGSEGPVAAPAPQVGAPAPQVGTPPAAGSEPVVAAPAAEDAVVAAPKPPAPFSFFSGLNGGLLGSPFGNMRDIAGNLAKSVSDPKINEALTSPQLIVQPAHT